MPDFPAGIAVVGLGYIGLPTAAALATQGVQVHGVDTSLGTVNAVNRGEVPFLEPDLAVSVSGAVARGLLRATTETPTADAFIVAVPTPIGASRSADLSYVRAATAAIAPRLRGGETVILESTSPPGTTLQMSRWLAEARPDLSFPHQGQGRADVSVAHCPERVLPGRIMIEIFTNDRIVGGLTPECSRRARAIYEVFCKGDIALSDAASAEMSKLAENAFRDVNLAFANELSLVCDELGLDVWEIITNANRHPRVEILKPGPGVGGHCIAVDPWFIVAAAPTVSRLIRTARSVNDGKPAMLAARIVESASLYTDPSIACLGLSFKADVEDLRESPALGIVDELAARLPSARLLVVEPHIRELPTRLRSRPNVRLSSANDAIARADIVVLLVDHEAFRVIPYTAVREKLLFDTRGMWRTSTARSAGVKLAGSPTATE